MTPHITRCLLAGIVALLPVGGTVLGIVWLERSLAESWLADQPWYFPGVGILCALALLYAVGLFVTTFLGRFLWRRVDRLLEGLPLLGTLYQSLKEVLGYDTGRERFFAGVVAVEVDGAQQLGLITGESTAIDGEARTIVFVPSAPNPTNGRLLFLRASECRRLEVRAADALRTLVAIGKTPLEGEG